ncbi:MFS transporter (plasmid) [Paraburkholderia sp. PREW-6R]|uniref:MFS transporter n=1 Tax=Paraburkholderia sp. PREW-6R TaxID=3141544 RepID=UPI0031F4AFC5
MEPESNRAADAADPCAPAPRDAIGHRVVREPRNDSDEKLERETLRRVTWRLMPYVFGLFLVSIVDRGNLGFAALSMNRQLHLTGAMFGIGVGLFFLAFAVFMIPSNLAMARFGARTVLTRIAIGWGAVTMLMAFVQGPYSFYALRALLGAAEAGIAPGLLLYLSYWFPARYRARNNAIFTYSVPASYVLTAIVSGWILEMDGMLGLPGWKWLFLLEGLPAIVLGIIGLRVLTDAPAQAAWLSAPQRDWLRRRLDDEAPAPVLAQRARLRHVIAHPLVLMLAMINAGIFAGLATLSTWLPQIVHTFGWSPHLLGPVVALPPAAGALGLFFVSRHSDRHGERVKHLHAMLLLAAAAYAVIALSRGPAAILAGFCFANIGIYASMTVFWTIPQTYLPRNIAAAGIGTISAAGSVAGFAVTTLIGRVQDATHSLTSCFSIVIVVLLVASGVLLIIDRQLREPPSSSAQAPLPMH